MNDNMTYKNLLINKVIRSIVNYFKRNIGILSGLIFIMILVSFLSENFLTASNLLNILRQISTNVFLAFGMSFVILICGIDLSVGSVLAFSGVLAAYMIGVWNWPVWLAVLAPIIICTLVGIFNGVIVTFTGIAAFVVTLSTQTIFRGFAMLIANGAPIRIINQAYITIGTSYLGPIAYPIIYTAFAMLVCYLLLNKTRFGRHIYALGGNRTAALFAGISATRVEVFVYALSSFLAGFAGIVLSSRMTAGVPASGEGYELDAIAAVVLGGASFTGGVGTIGGTLIGAIIIGVLNNGLNMLNVAAFWQYVAKGVVILLAVLTDVLRKKRKERSSIIKMK
ncbi:MAG: ribose ABC transporter permease [Eubacteriales bacterium]|nr:ribose ABC transporter permease [Eubacteriales bacterium]